MRVFGFMGAIPRSKGKVAIKQPGGPGSLMIPLPGCYFRPGGAGNLNFYGCGGPDETDAFGACTSRAASWAGWDRLKSQVEQITKEADAQRHAIGEEVPAGTAPIGIG